MWVRSNTILTLLTGYQTGSTTRTTDTNDTILDDNNRVSTQNNAPLASPQQRPSSHPSTTASYCTLWTNWITTPPSWPFSIQSLSKWTTAQTKPSDSQCRPKNHHGEHKPINLTTIWCEIEQDSELFSWFIPRLNPTRQQESMTLTTLFLMTMMTIDNGQW